MKRLIYLPVVLAILISCKQSDSKDSQKVIELEQRLRLIQDSIAQSSYANGSNSTSSNQPVDNYVPDSINTKIEEVEGSNGPSSEIKTNRKKYVYVKVLTEEPDGLRTIKGTDPYLTTNGDWVKGTPDKSYITTRKFVYNSNINEVTSLTPDDKYRLMDQYSNRLNLRDQFRSFNGEDEYVKGKILDRKCLVFDSYEEASKHKFSNKNDY